MKYFGKRNRVLAIWEQPWILFHTLRYLQPRQIYLRLWGEAKRRVRIGHLPKPPTNLVGGCQPFVAFLHHDPWNGREQIRQGVFRFLNHSESLGQPINWQASHLPLLWQFNLHYFHYLFLLDHQEQAGLCRKWIAANPAGTKVAWHPYPTSLRIVNWCKADFDDTEILKSLYTQAAYLFRHREAHHPGNHLLENAKALIFAGSFFQDQGEADDWLETGIQIYRRETPVQVLSDGGYFERSPMYHAIMIEGYLDIINLLPPMHRDRELFVDAAKRMSDFLVSTTKPDGEIALFNDATREIASPPAAILGYAERLLNYRATKRAAFEETGYFIHESDDLYLIIDGGVLGPDYLLAHAHADIFSYELSLGGKAFVVDSGVYEYAAGEMRQYVRSTAAHNTVCVDGKSQAECWASFRVARRYPPEQVSFQKTNSICEFRGSFAGFAKLIGDDIVHQRVMRCDESRREISVENTITGRNRHLVESRVHLHPEVEIKVQGNQVLLKRSDVQCVIEFPEQQQLRVEAGWYCPEFGMKLANQVLVFSADEPLPVRLAYRILY